MKIQSPWMGRVRGSAGNMTGCKIYDKNVMRAKAFEVSNPNTAAQQVQRGYFADLIELVAGFSPEQLRTIFPNKPKAMSRRNALTKQLAEYITMEGSEKVIDFANIDTLGNAPTMDMGTTEVTFDEDTLVIDLDSKLYSSTKLGNYYFCVAIINITQKEIFLPNVFTDVATGSLEVPAPSTWESTDELSAFPLITDSKEAVSGFGTISIMKRPVKKSN